MNEDCIYVQNFVDKYLEVNKESFYYIFDTFKNNSEVDKLELLTMELLEIAILEREGIAIKSFTTQNIKRHIINHNIKNLPKWFNRAMMKFFDTFIDLSFPNLFDFDETGNNTDICLSLGSTIPALYKLAFMKGKKIIIPNFPRKYIADYYNVDIDDLITFYVKSQDAYLTDLRYNGSLLFNSLVPNDIYYLRSIENKNSFLKMKLSMNSPIFMSDKMINTSNILPYGYVNATVEKESLEGDFYAERVYYKKKIYHDVKLKFSQGDIEKIHFKNDDEKDDIITNSVLNSSDLVDFFFGVNNAVENFCGYLMYDRCINTCASLIFYDESSNAIQFSSRNINITDKKYKQLI